MCTLKEVKVYANKIEQKIIQGLKKGLVVAKKLVVNDFWLVVNGDSASHNNYSMHASCITENYSYMCCAHL